MISCEGNRFVRTTQLRAGLIALYIFLYTVIMLSDDEDFFTNRATGGAVRVPQNRNREATPNPFADHPDIDIDLDLDLPGVGRSEVNEETPLQQLIRYWMNERHAPDILPVQQALLANLLDTVRKQVCTSPLVHPA